MNLDNILEATYTWWFSIAHGTDGNQSIVRYVDGVVFKTHFLHAVYLREKNILHDLVGCIGFPDVLEYRDDTSTIIMKNHGVPMTICDLTLDIHRQFVDIKQILFNKNIRHNDIKKENILLKDGIVTLIDFGQSLRGNNGFPYRNSFDCYDNKIDHY